MSSSGLLYRDIRFHEKIGQGGYAIVHRVTFKRPFMGIYEAVAKKVREFKSEEVIILEKLNHPHVVRLYGHVQEGPMHLILFEYAPLGTVYDYIKKRNSKPVPPELLTTWTKHCILAVEYLHQNNVIHRDIKSKNCLIFENHVLKLSDFGLAKVLDSTLTISSTKGTWRYMAPEIHKEKHYSCPSDIYAYAMLILEMASGKEPFHGMEWAEVSFKVTEKGHTPDVPNTCPDQLKDLLRRCWSINPASRPGVQEIKDTLSRVYPETPFASSTPMEVVNTSVDVPVLKIRKFPQGLDIAGFQRAKAIVTCPTEEIVVVDTCSGNPCAHILSKSGNYKLSLQSPTTRPQGKLESIENLAITSLGHIVVVDQSRTVKLFNVEGKYLYSFVTVTKDEMNSIVDTTCVAVDNENHILVGDFKRQVVTIHDGTDGSIVQMVTLRHHPCYLTVNGKKQIIVSDWTSRIIEAVDYNGRVIFTFTAIIDGKDGQPRGVVCDKNDNIYVAVAEYEKSIDNTKINSGQVLKYNSRGQFISSVVQGLYWPHGITLNNDSLFVANSLSVIKIKI